MTSLRFDRNTFADVCPAPAVPLWNRSGAHLGGRVRRLVSLGIRAAGRVPRRCVERRQHCLPNRHPGLKWLSRLAYANVISQAGSYETSKMAIATRCLQDIQQDWSVGIGWANERT